MNHLIMRPFIKSFLITSFQLSFFRSSGVLTFFSSLIGILMAFTLVLLLSGNGCHKEDISKWWHISPAWSPDGKHLAFECHRKLEEGEQIIPEDTMISFIKILNLETNDVIDFASGTDADWSPDGRKIICVSFPVGMRMIDVATKEVKPLGWGFSPNWSYDGFKILFCRDSSGTSKIFMMDTTQASIKFIVEGWDPDWHPDGDKFIFTHDDNIYMADTNGNIIALIIPKSDSLTPAGAQIANSKYIVYVGVHNKGQWCKNCYIHVRDTLGNDFKLTDGSSPSWSPDGSKIVFARYSKDEDATSIWVMNRDGSNLKRVTNSE